FGYTIDQRGDEQRFLRHYHALVVVVKRYVEKKSRGCLDSKVLPQQFQPFEIGLPVEEMSMQDRPLTELALRCRKFITGFDEVAPGAHHLDQRNLSLDIACRPLVA